MASEEFPYLAHSTPRPGQLEMIQNCRNTLRNGGHHLAAAPTGIGKTAASLAAALEVAIESERKKTILFLTSRQSQHRIVIDTLQRLNQSLPAEKRIKAVDMIGQSGMCTNRIISQERKAIHSILCSQARQTRSCKEFLNSSPSLTNQILASPMHVVDLVELAKIHTEASIPKPVCAWKAAREAAPRADVIVGDYNHLFNDSVRDNSLEAMKLELDDIIVIVDEAHNLPDRIRNSMSRVLNPLIMKNAGFDIEEYTGKLKSTVSQETIESTTVMISMLNWCKDVVAEWRKLFIKRIYEWKTQLSSDGGSDLSVDEMDIWKMIDEACDLVEKSYQQTTLVQTTANTVPKKEYRVETLARTLANVVTEVDTELVDSNENDAEKISILLNNLKRFQGTSALSVTFEEGTRQEGKLNFDLLDPGLVSADIFKKVHSSILMSGTLYPPNMYGDILAIDKKEMTLCEYESPFNDNRRPVICASNVSTLYKERNEDTFARIRSYVRAMCEASPGHVAVFFPSYGLMEGIMNRFKMDSQVKILEGRDWDKQKCDQILQTLFDERENGRQVLLCGVYGAKLSEGIDYHDGILDAVVCTGLQIPPPSAKQEDLKEYCSDRFGKSKAWKYTVSQPSINKILQSMGRPIRSLEDRAVILLLDHRNLNPTYKSCYPRHLSMIETTSEESVKRMASRFFRKTPREEFVHSTT